MRLEFVEEVQGVASFLQRAGDAAANEGRKQRPVVCEAMATVEVCKTGCCCRQGERENW
jgi:hypothetical protein